MDSFEDEELLKLVELEEETNNEAENLITEDELLQIDDRLFPNQNSETFITEEEFLEKQSLDISDVTPSSEPKEEFSFNLDDSSDFNQIRNNPFALLLTGNIIWDTNGSSGSFSSSCIAQM